MNRIVIQTTCALALVSIILQTIPVSAAKWECGERSNLSLEGKNYCAASDFRQSDSRLGKVFENVLRRHTADYDDVGALRDSQNAFTSYRDNQCIAENRRLEDQPYHPMVVAQCKNRLTNLRIDELNRMLD